MNDPADHLFDLLPAVVRSADAVRGHALRDLLRVIGEESQQLEDDIRQMYENLFVETAEPWAVPYLGDLVGHRPMFVPPGPEDPCDGDRRAQALHLRRAVADRLGLVRRKGTLSVLDDLVEVVTGWSAVVDDPGGAPLVRLRLWRVPSWPLTRVRPFYLPRRTNCFALSVLGNDAPLFTRAGSAADGTAADGLARVPRRLTGDMLEEDLHRHYGQDRALQLYENDHPISAERITVQDLADWSPEVFGEQVAVDPVRGRVMFPERYRPRRFTASYHHGFPADTGGGEYPRPLAGATVGSSLFREGHLAGRGAPLLETLRCSDDVFTTWLRELIGTPVLEGLADGPREGPRALEHRLDAELNRVLQAHALADGPLAEDLPLDDETTGLLNQRPRGPRRVRLNRLLLEAVYPEHVLRSFGLVRVTSGTDTQVIMDAVRSLQRSQRPPVTTVVELADSGLYVEPVVVELPPHHTLELRAAEGCRPTVVLPERGADIDDMVISCGYGSRVVLDGIMVARRAVRIVGNPLDVRIRHCTFVPGWELDENCEPCCGAEPSLVVTDIPVHEHNGEDDRYDCPPELLVPTRVRLDRSVVGTVLIQRDEVDADPVRLDVCRSIVDATSDEAAAVTAPNDRTAHAVLSVVGSTVRGRTMVHAVEVVENSIFTGETRVARRQVGCVRFSYVPPGSRTPPRHACQPDLVVHAADEPDQEREAERVVPRFADPAIRYGRPDYCRLDDACATEILRGADDASEMGVWHDLYQPQRLANLESAVTEFLPLGWDVDRVVES